LQLTSPLQPIDKPEALVLDNENSNDDSIDEDINNDDEDFISDEKEDTEGTTIIRASSTPITMEIENGKGYTNGTIYKKLLVFNNLQNSYWQRKTVSLKRLQSMDHWAKRYPIVEKWRASLEHNLINTQRY